MNWTLVALDAQPPQPWRNGGGITRELLAWPTAADWRVRLSVADVQAAGPFSRFDGIERWFAVLEGDGVVLRSDFGSHRLTADSEPLRFEGGLAMDCTLLGGATRDFNLMARPGRARMRRMRGLVDFHAGAGTLLALYTHAGGAQLCSDDALLDVPPYHLAWGIAAAPVRGYVSAEDALWLEAMT